jgi:hypothetical protein
MDKYPLPQFILPLDYDMMLGLDRNPSPLVKAFNQLIASKRHYTTIYISVFPKDVKDDRLEL